MSEAPAALSDVPAVILAGGRGTRLRSVLPDTQKVVAAVGARPFISYLLDLLAAAGLRQVTLCTGYRAEQVAVQFGEQYGPLRLSYSPEPEPLGTAGAIRLAAERLSADTLFALNGDSYCQTDLAAFWAFHQQRAARGSLVLTQVPDIVRYGRVVTGPDDAVTGFEEKGGGTGRGWINAGIYTLTRPLLDQIPAGRAVSIEREMFPAWVGQGLYAWPGGGRFIDIGTPATYDQADTFFNNPSA